MELLTTTGLYLIGRLIESIADGGIQATRKGILKAWSQQTFKERFRVTIQETIDVYRKEHASKKSEQLHFTESEALIQQLLAFDFASREKNLLKTTDFEHLSQIETPLKEELDTFFEMLQARINGDQVLLSLFYEENHKGAAVRTETIVREIQGVVKKLESVSQIAPTLSVFPEITASKFKLDRRALRTTFVGRSQEMQILNEFVELKARFSWWILTGLAGCGKSRLAYEFCLKTLEKENFVCGFITASEILTLSNMVTEQPVLYIIDYAAQYYEQILSSLKVLSNKTTFNHTVRILLVEREIEGEWWSNFANNLSVSSTLFRQEPLKLKGLNDIDLVAIVQQTLKKEGSDLVATPETIMPLMHTLDTQHRPLFAMMLGVALADNKSLIDWKQEDVLQHWIVREEDIVKRKFAEVDEDILYQHKNLLVLATICGGLSGTALQSLFNRNITWLPTSYSYNNSLYSELAGLPEENADFHLAPVSPHILGEFFVLQSFTPNSKYRFRDPDRIDQIKSLAKEFSYYVQFFIRRTIQDFPRHPSTPKLFLSNIESHTNYRGFHGQSILRLMYNSLNREDLLTTLWDFTQRLYLEDKISVDRFIFLDKPDRVFQEASLIMVTYYSGSLDKQLYYYKIMQSVTDEYKADPIPIHISTPESSLDALGYDAAKELFRNVDRLKEHIERDTAVWSDIPCFECEAICHLMDNLISTDSDGKIEELLSRANELKQQFVDPRIVKLYSEMLIVTKISTGPRLDDELLQQYEIIKKVPIQAPDINVPLEKVRFVQLVNEYYLRLGEREKAKFYFADLMRLLPSSLSPAVGDALIQMAHTAALAIEFLMKKEEIESAAWYLDEINKIRNLFRPYIVPIIEQMIEAFTLRLK